MNGFAGSSCRALCLQRHLHAVLVLMMPRSRTNVSDDMTTFLPVGYSPETGRATDEPMMATRRC